MNFLGFHIHNFKSFIKLIPLFLMAGFILNLSKVHAQVLYTISGKVVDARNGSPLAFVNIQVNDKMIGTVSDIDGNFHFSSSQPIDKLQFSYIGYETLVLERSSLKQKITVKLRKTEIELKEVTIYPGQNPALRIIRNAINNRKRNNIENLPGFSYNAYEKTVFSIKADSLLLADTNSLDTNLRRLREFINRQHLLVIENYIDRQFQSPNKNIEKVVATKVSGLKDPIFVFLLSQLQSSTFYEDVFSIGGQNFINPLAENSIEKYFYQLEDTIISGHDTTYIIFYRPWKGKNFDGLKGVLHINSNGWAVSSVTAEPYQKDENFEIKVQQLYEQDSNGIWFPSQLNIDLIMNIVQINAGNQPTPFRIIASGKTYIENFKLIDIPTKDIFSHIEIDVIPEAIHRDEDYWQRIRAVPIDEREKETYRVIDSLGAAHNLDRFTYTLDAFMKGKIAIKKVNLDLEKLMRYNGHEGFYAGLGLETNDLFSRRWQTGAYWGYGLKDKTAKWGAFLQFNLPNTHDSYFRYDYQFDKQESGVIEFTGRNFSGFDPYTYRNFQINRMDALNEHQLSFSTRIFEYTNVWLALSIAEFNPAYDYRFIYHEFGNNEIFNFSELSASFRWAYGEKFIRTTKGKVSLGTKFPVVWFQFNKGLDFLPGGDFDYFRTFLDVTYSFYTPFIGKTSLRLNAGMASSNLPSSKLFNARANHADFTLFSPGSFTTMRMNEFYSDRFIAFFAQHNFGHLLFRSGKFQPELELFSSVLFSNLRHPEYHEGISMKTAEEGYFESGLLIHRLIDFGFYNLGIGTAWRYGTYSLPRLSDNLALMLSLNFNI